MRAVLGLGVFLSSAWVNAQEQNSAPVASVTSSADITGQLIQLLFGLLLVIAVIFLLAWFVRRIQHSLPVSKANQSIRLLATQPLGPRERLLLVQVGKEQILLGLTPGTIEPLHVLQEPIEIDDEPGGASDFGKKFKSLLKAQVQTVQDNKESP
ncbi:MAG: flagellar biosynthetic protein FliO [Thiopseudomonas sp.]|nr:flagellar biosynthetic protein FliO [Thiopseudomonas sp.]MCK9465429.1 flagellar biosynthetic protein FliO [Thiopseudomonas sp.]